MILARLLTPAEVGVFSVAMVLLAYLSSLRDLGAGQYLVQEKELTQERIRATWTVQLGLGLLFAVIVFVAAGPIADFYAEPRMRAIMHVLALNFAVSPFGSLTYAWLMREMKFGSLAIMRFASSLFGAIVSIALAWYGWGPISLAYGSLVSTVINAMIAIFFRPPAFPWLPGIKELRRVVSFGGNITIASIATTVVNSAPEMVLGKMQGMAAAGLFSRANGLATMFNRLILDATHAVALPLFAKQAREKGDAAQAFLKSTSYVSALGWSFFLGLFFLAQPTIRLLYGAQWDESVDLTRILAIAFVLSLPSAMSSVVLTAIGSIQLVVKATLLVSAQYVVAVAIGASISLTATAIALIVAKAMTAIIWLYMSQKDVRFTWRQLADTLGRSALVALASAIPPAIAFAWFHDQPDAIASPLVTSIPASVALFVGGVFISNHPIKEEVLSVWNRVRAARR